MKQWSAIPDVFGGKKFLFNDTRRLKTEKLNMILTLLTGRMEWGLEANKHL